MTERLLKAIENPNVSILGHPTGRICFAATLMRSTWTRS